MVSLRSNLNNPEKLRVNRYKISLDQEHVEKIMEMVMFDVMTVEIC